MKGDKLVKIVCLVQIFRDRYNTQFQKYVN